MYLGKKKKALAFCQSKLDIVCCRFSHREMLSRSNRHKQNTWKHLKDKQEKLTEKNPLICS